jgi:hypothetical protein
LAERKLAIGWPLTCTLKAPKKEMTTGGVSIFGSFALIGLIIID